MIKLTRKEPKKPIKKDLEEIVAEQQAIIEEQGKNIQDLQLAIDDLLLLAMNLREGI